MTKASRLKRLDYLKDQLRKRIVILDGAMGTNIQKFKLKEEDYRGRALLGYGIVSQRPEEQQRPSRADQAGGDSGRAPPLSGYGPCGYH